MPAIHVLGGMCTGHACYPPRPNLQASENVFAEGIAVHRQGDMWGPHACGSSVHTGVLAAGSSTVFVNGKPCARLGDPISCGSNTLDGVGTVFAGG